MACRPPVTWGETDAENPEKSSLVREACGRPTKIAMFAWFCPSKKPLFSLFLQILPFPAKIQNKKTLIRLVSTNPKFCAQCLPNWWRKSTLKRALRTDKKNNVLFCSCDDVIKPNEIKLRPCAPLCGSSFLWKRFFKMVYPFQRYCLKTVSSAHRPTL